MKKLLELIKKYKFVIIGIFLIIIVIFGIGLISKQKQQARADEEYRQKVEEAKDVAGHIITKDMIILKGTKLSTNPKDYIHTMPIKVDLNDVKLDTTKVDINKVGIYEFVITYYETENSGSVIVVETQEEVDELRAKQEEELKKRDEISKNLEENNNEGQNGEAEEPEEENPGNTTPQKPGILDTETDPDLFEQEVVVTPSKTNTQTNPDYTVTQYSSFYKPLPTDVKPNMSGYNNEFWIRFEKPIILDDKGSAAFSNWYQNAYNSLSSEFFEIAKATFGEEVPYCYQSSEIIFALNKSNHIVGVIAKGVIGVKDEYGLCGSNQKTVYLNQRTTLTLNDESYSFQ